MENEDLTIEELEIFFAEYADKLPQTLDVKGGRITNVAYYVESHIHTYKNNRNARVFDIFRLRLIELKKMLLEQEEKEK